MNVLVTAGNTHVPIDRVRVMTSIFTGRTGAAIARCANERGHQVTLLTSRPEALIDLQSLGERWRLLTYRTFDELHELLAGCVTQGRFDAVIHAAAVSDYRTAGIFTPAGTPGRLIDVAADKVKGDHAELWIRMVPTPKLIDRLRHDWNYKGVLVKFKLEGVDDRALLQVAELSRNKSQADLIVANTLEGSATWAYVGPVHGEYQRVSRRELPTRLMERVEQVHAERGHG